MKVKESRSNECVVEYTGPATVIYAREHCARGKLKKRVPVESLTTGAVAVRALDQFSSNVSIALLSTIFGMAKKLLNSENHSVIKPFEKIK